MAFKRAIRILHPEFLILMQGRRTEGCHCFCEERTGGFGQPIICLAVENGNLESLQDFGRPLPPGLTLFLDAVPSTELIPLRFDSVVVVVEFFLGGRREGKCRPTCGPCVADRVPGHRRTLYPPVNLKILRRV
jgi:hypothetical protein